MDLSTDETQLLEDLRALLGSEEGQLLEPLTGFRTRQLLDFWPELDPAERERLMGVLDPEDASDLLASLSSEEQSDMLEALSPERAAGLLEELDPDDLADTLQGLEAHDPEQAHEMRAMLAPETLAVADVLTAYDEEEAGGLMTPEFVAVQAGMTVQQVLAFLRRAAPDAETI
jgi:magnesium transporter